MRPSFFYPGLSVNVDHEPKRTFWLVCRADANAIALDGGWERMPPHEAEMALFAARLVPSDVERFLNRARAHGSLPEGYDRYYSSVAELEHLVASGDLVALCESATPDRERERVREEREVARAIMNGQRTLGLVPGRRSLLMSGADFQAMPNRDRYKVLSRAEATTLLSAAEMAAAAIWERAIALLAPDWRIPQTPQGLVLLLETPTVVASGVSVPAITPSQMRSMLEKATLDIHVVDLNGVAQDGLTFEITKPDGDVDRGVLDNEGRAKVKSAVPGVFVVRFPDLDGADWDGDGALELPDVVERGKASSYTIQQGDRLPSIALDHGFFRWQTVWEFNGCQGNPFVLRPDATVSIPSRLGRVAEVEGGQAEYVVQWAPEILRVRFADAAGDDPVTFRATPDKGDDMFEGELSEDGLMEVELPPGTKVVDVELFAGDGEEPFVSYRLDVGHLDPCKDVPGVQGRLANLGYSDGGITGEIDDATRSAIVQFRRDYGLPLSDEIDDDLRDALRWLHDEDDGVAEGEADHTTPEMWADDESPDEGDSGGEDRNDSDDVRDADGDGEAVGEEDGDDDSDDEPEIWDDDEWDDDNGDRVADADGDGRTVDDDSSREVKPW